MPTEMQNTMFAAEEAGGGAKARFNTLVVKAKQLARDGYVSKALDLNKKALKLFNNEKLIRRIKKMEVCKYATVLAEFSQYHILILNAFWEYGTKSHRTKSTIWKVDKRILQNVFKENLFQSVESK